MFYGKVSVSCCHTCFHRYVCAVGEESLFSKQQAQFTFKSIVLALKTDFFLFQAGSATFLQRKAHNFFKHITLQVLVLPFCYQCLSVHASPVLMAAKSKFVRCLLFILSFSVMELILPKNFKRPSLYVYYLLTYLRKYLGYYNCFFFNVGSSYHCEAGTKVFDGMVITFLAV